MVSIILASNEETKAMAIAAGFREETVLIRSSGLQSTEENRRKLEAEMRAMKPYQFLAADYWGMCNPD